MGPVPSLGLRPWQLLAVALLAGLTAACASTPEASRERDDEAKHFAVNPAAATLYLYREGRGTALDQADSVLYADERLIGSTLPASYFRVYVRAGAHRLHGYGPDHGFLDITTRNGELYFISVRVVGGFSNFRLENPAAAKREISECCGRLENWAPGQRPLLR